MWWRWSDAQRGMGAGAGVPRSRGVVSDFAAAGGLDVLIDASLLHRDLSGLRGGWNADIAVKEVDVSSHTGGADEHRADVSKSEAGTQGGAVAPARAEGGVALSMSGGGIRSATFGLGVLQGLAAKGWLKRFDYISTVSGGGYIGAWFFAQVARARARIRAANGSDDHTSSAEALDEVVASLGASAATGAVAAGGTHQRDAIAWLRSYSNYLSPTWGLSKDALTLVALYLRNLVIHWSVLIPAIAALLLVPRAVHLLIHGQHGLAMDFMVVIAGLAVLMAAFSTNGPPVDGEHRSRGVNEGWLRVCYVIPLFVIPLLLTGLAAAPPTSIDLMPSGPIEGPIEGFAFVGAALYAVGSVLALLFRLCFLLVPDPAAGQSNRRAAFLRRALFVEEGVSPASNTKVWLRRFPYRILLSVLTGALAGAFCGVAFHIATGTSMASEVYSIFMPLLFVLAIWLASVLRVAIGSKLSTERSREWWARTTGAALVGTMLWVALGLLTLWAPWVILGLPMLRSELSLGATGFGGMLLAVATAAIGFWSKHGAGVTEKVRRWSDRLGGSLLNLAAMVTLTGFGLLLSLLIAVGVAAFTEQPVGSSAVAGACVPSEDLTAGVAASAGPVRLKCETWKVPEPVVGSVDGSESEAFGRVALSTTECVLDAWKDSPEASTEMETCEAVVKRVASSEDGTASAHSAHAPSFAPFGSACPLGCAYRAGLMRGTADALLLLAAALILCSMLISALTGANIYSLHSMYANRLTRAYLGASNRDAFGRDPITDFNRNDDLPLASLSGIRPTPVINAALNMVKAQQWALAWQQRKAMHFPMSPDLCGHEMLGTARTARYGARNGGLTLGRAMTISGAAVSPSMGHHSSVAVSALLALFNLRLGYWLPNPRAANGDPGEGDGRLQREGPAFGWLAILREFLSQVDSGKRYVYLSDGGHFENLGIYEMLRRRCGTIIAVDAGGDPKFAFADVENAIRKARVDLGVIIDIPDMLASTRAIRAGALRHLRGTITYPDGAVADLILLKPVLCGDEPFDVIRYAETVCKSGSPFPQQTTADQFFDEAQFESYRMLGYHTVQKVFGVPLGDEADPVLHLPPAPAKELLSRFTATPGEPNQIPVGAGVGFGQLFGGMGEAVKSMGAVGQAVVAASAISITGMIGVGGFVSLKDSTVSLEPATISIDQASIEQLKSAAGEFAKGGGAGPGVHIDASAIGAQITDSLTKVDWDAVSRSGGFERLISGMRSALEGIKVSVSQDGPPINVTIVSGNGRASNQPLFEEAARAADRLFAAISAMERPSADLKEAMTRLDSASKSLLSAMEQGEPAEILKAIDRVNDYLQKIEENVEAISPRNSVRGG